MPLLITAILVVGVLALIVFSVCLVRFKTRAINEARLQVGRLAKELKHRSEEMDDQLIEAICKEDIGEAIQLWRRSRADLMPTATAGWKPGALQEYLSSESHKAGQEINGRLLWRAVFGFCAIIGTVVLSSLAIYSLDGAETQTVSSTMNQRGN